MLPKRAIVAIVTTAIGLILLFSFKTPDTPGVAAISSRSAVVGGPGAVPTAAVVVASSPSPGNGQGNPPGGGGGQGQGNPPGGGQGGQGGAGGGTIPANANGTVTGPAVDTRFGTVQVQVTFSKGKITDITALQLPNTRRRDQMLSQYAAPVLRSEALQAQSAQIDTVSGATYTSMGYEQSLQGAIDQAHA